MDKHPRIVVIGGGTGSYTLLQALKERSSNLAALVNMADDGGSTGVLRDELGVLPPGDVRQCLVALSGASQELRDLFTFRFPTGSFEGHSFGNIFLSAVQSMTHNFDDAVRMAGDVLNIQGRVLPITLDDCTLVMDHNDGTVEGQRAIELTNLSAHCHPTMRMRTKARMTPEAGQAIKDAELVVIAPGNLYGSLAPALIVDGVSAALAETSAQVVFVCNLVNKPNHTTDFTVDDYVQELERLSERRIIDTVLYNTDIPDADLLGRYALEKEFPVIIDEQQLKGAPYQAIGGRFLSNAPIARNPNDNFIKRSLIRHDASAVTAAIMKLITNT